MKSLRVLVTDAVSPNTVLIVPERRRGESFEDWARRCSKIEIKPAPADEDHIDE